MKVFFGSVVYPSMLPFFGDFISSLQRQEYKDYTLLLINDGVEEEILEKGLSDYSHPYIIVNNLSGSSPPEIRTMMLIEAKRHNCDLLILGDSDDYFSDDRVSRIVESARESSDYTFFYNIIASTDKQPVMPDLPAYTTNYKHIAEYNYLGMSNTAIRLDIIPKEFLMSLYECKLPIYDWYLFSRLLLDGNKGVFVNGCFTYYRFHDNNTIGKLRRSDEAIRKEVEIKLQQYKLLANYSKEAESLYELYSNGEYHFTNTSVLCYWWNYTTAGGNLNEVLGG